MPGQYLLAIDQGTTSTRAIVFGIDGAPVASAQVELKQYYPQPGWVEHDAEEIWSATLSVVRRALANARLTAGDIAALGITNQRETTVIWDRATGKPIHHALVWQDRRTADWCRRMLKEIGDAELGKRTGLLFDAYFSGSKIAWLLENVEGARAAAAAGRLAFGTIDTFLLWRLTGGKVHATDATNAARTMIFDIGRQKWDEDLLKAFEIPVSLLPDVRDSAADFGSSDAALFGGPIAIRGIAGDQQAATVGQACFTPGMVKSTYGTGCFVLLNTGAKFVRSKNRLLSTVAYRLKGKATYALEGSIFISGAVVQWVRDGLKAVAKASDSEAIARSIPDNGGVYLVPAFTGLGAPWWDPDARGAIFGLTRDSGLPQIVRAALESTAYQTRDLMGAMRADMGPRAALAKIRVDGGMVANDWVMQFLADQLGLEVDRPRVTETTAWGAAALAGLGAGVYSSVDDIARARQADRLFAPQGDAAANDKLYAAWRDAVARVRSDFRAKTPPKGLGRKR
ncbi:MAG: glycerol kinase GlpK [Alphaproteobacteria bacterium]|nr:glycerol kinase GlpK [Alphaproteobacteria bacterium]